MGGTGEKISVVSLGGHEYLPDKRSRGFNEDLAKAITPGHLFPGFGRERRRRVLKTAFDHGVNFFDVTMDSEKEALGRNLAEMPPPYPVFVQTRPEGFVYTYDENNARMAKYDLIKAEAARILGLLRRERIEFFNFAFMRAALRHDREYLAKIADNAARLKKEGLIQYACADTFSGEETYLRQIAAGCFDAVYVNFNLGDRGARENVFPAAAKAGMGVISREAFMKGALFRMAGEAGVADADGLARAALKWCLSAPEVTTVVYGTGDAGHLENALAAADDPAIGEEENALLERIAATGAFGEFRAKKEREFFEGM
jgi:aryl-alcohol dehydrogenase-like predicted oxidoreductase